VAQGERGRALVYKRILILTHHYYLFNHRFDKPSVTAGGFCYLSFRIEGDLPRAV
jgi:hypothetical protein